MTAVAIRQEASGPGVSPDDSAALDARLARALAPWLGRGEGLLLAVSGGPDSMALLHAAARGSAAAGTMLAVATVDHGLRPDATDEAEAVARLAHHLGLPHATLRWQGSAGSGLQAAAREGRYRLLAGHAVALGAARVLTAHTADDQAETVLMRLIAGSGPAGLAGMRRERPLGEGIVLCRPFLDLTKADLTAYCAAHGLVFVRDPSNADPRFARARLRTLLPALAAEGLSAERLRRLALRLSRDEAALGQAAQALLAAASRPGPKGGLVLDGARLLAAPEAVALRAMDLALEALQPEAGPGTPRRLERLERLVLDALLPALAAGASLRRTLRGLVVAARADGRVTLAPAPPRRRGWRDPGDGRAAGTSDLLGKAGGGAYIGPECPD